MRKSVITVIATLLVAVAVNAQMNLGVTAGFNLTHEATSFNGTATAKSVVKPSMMGLTIGPTLEMMLPIPSLGEIGLEVTTLYSQKGFNFHYEINNPDKAYNIMLEGSKNVNYLEVPLNLKWKFGLPEFKLFLKGGWYWEFAVDGNVVVENAEDLSNNNQKIDALIRTSTMKFGDNSASPYLLTDTGFTFGAGFEVLEMLQLSVDYSWGIQSTTFDKSIEVLLKDSKYSYSTGDFNISSKNKALAVRLTYFF